jgi:hypothetical protein
VVCVNAVLVQVMYIAIRKGLVKVKVANEYLLFAVCLALGLAGTFLANIGWIDSVYLIVSRVMFGLPFVSFGYLYRVKLEKFDATTAVNFVAGMVLLLMTQFSLLHIYGSMDYDPLHMAFQGRLLQPFLSSFTGIWLCLQVWKAFAWLFKPKTWVSRGIKVIGNKSWDIMVHQFLGFWLLSAAFRYLGADDFDFVAFKTNIYYR